MPERSFCWLFAVVTSGILVVQTTPTWATIEVDGQAAGRTAPADPASPAELTIQYLSPGTHEVLLSRPCHAPSRHTVAIAVGETARLNVLLERTVAALTVTAETPGTVYLDDVLQGTTPWTGESAPVPPGAPSKVPTAPGTTTPTSTSLRGSRNT